MNTPIVVNLFAGPGTGKSTTAAGVFSKLKLLGVNCELVNEFAKTEVWAGNPKSLQDQLYVSGNQYHKQFILKDEVDVIVTDSPLLLAIIYNQEYEIQSFNEVILEAFHKYNNLNYFLERVKPFNPKGRNQNEDESKVIDQRILRLLKGNEIEFRRVPGDERAVDHIVNKVMGFLYPKQL